MRGTILFVEKFRLHAIGIPLHRQRSILQMRQKKRRDPDVVIDQFTLRESRFRIKDFVEIRNRQFPTFDDQLRFVAHRLQVIP